MYPDTRRASMAAVTSLCLLLGAIPGAGRAESSPAKKELAARAVQLQAPGIELMARSLAEQPAAAMLRDAAQVIQERIAPDQRQAVGKKIQDSARKYVDETVPLLRERALKLAPASLGAALEERFSEDELKQLVAWLDSPVSRKYQQAVPDMQNGFVAKLVAETRPLVDPKLQVLEQAIRTALGLPNAAAAAPPAARASAAGPAKPTAK